MTTRTTPRTAAGRALREQMLYHNSACRSFDDFDAVTAAILAIEDESYGNGLVGAQYEASSAASSASWGVADSALYRALMEATSPAAKRGPLAKARQQARVLLRDLSPKEEGQ